MIDLIQSFKGELGSPSNSFKYSKTLLAVSDTEYTQLNSNQNVCLSYQIAVYNMFDGSYTKDIYYPDIKTEVRLRFTELLYWMFRLAGVPDKEISGYHVVLVCHFCTAEWSMLRDRLDIAHYFEFLYKTLISFKSQSYVLEYVHQNGYGYEITFELSDTMLLLPPSHRSLQKATSLLDTKYHKKELSKAEKEDMLSLLQNNPIRFEEYAIHDADITLRLFIKLQFLLNEINGTTNKRYTTIGSATVKHFKSFIKENFPNGTFESQFSNKNEIYQQGLNLAKRAYMGGLNSSYFVGEVEGELFLDIDFSSAYPTVMNLLQIGNFGKKVEYEKLNSEDFTLGGFDD